MVLCHTLIHILVILVSQYIGSMDNAQQSGAEQVYIPLQSSYSGGATRWNPGAKIIVYDPTQENVLIQIMQMVM